MHSVKSSLSLPVSQNSQCASLLYYSTKKAGFSTLFITALVTNSQKVREKSAAGGGRRAGGQNAGSPWLHSSAGKAFEGTAADHAAKQRIAAPHPGLSSHLCVAEGHWGLSLEYNNTECDNQLAEQGFLCCCTNRVLFQDHLYHRRCLSSYAV